MAVNTGKYNKYGNKNENTEEQGYRTSRENDKLDRMYGFERVKDTQERTGYLINMHSVSIMPQLL